MKFEKTPLGELPEDWKVVKIHEVFDLYKGTTPSTKIKHYWSGEIPFVTPTDVVNADIFLQNTRSKITIQGLKSKSLKIVPVKSLLFTSRATIGYLAINLVPVAVNQGIISLIPKEEVSILYFYYHLLHRKAFFEKIASGSTYKEISMSSFKNINVALPPLPEQKAIAVVLSTVDKAIEKSDEAIKRIERLKKAAMKKLLTRGIINGFMFDTNIFNKILDDKIDLSKLPREFNYYVTHIQHGELSATPSRQRRESLLKIFKKLKKEDLPTESLVLDVSRLDYAKLSNGKLYNELLLKLKELDKKNGKKKTWKNQVGDVLIAETCIKNDLILVSNDGTLREVVKMFGGKAISLGQFLEGEYRKFKGTEIGKLPEDWEVAKLEHIVKFEKGAEPGRASYTNDGVPFIRVKDLTSMTNSGVYIKENNAFLKCNPNDILIALDGSPGVVVKGFYGYFSSGIRKVKLLDDMEEKVDYDYLFYILQSKLIQSTIKRYSFGVTIKHAQRAIPHLVIPLPPLPEQKKIAEILSTIDKRLELEKKRKEKLERVKKWLMNELLTGRKRLDVDKVMKIAGGKLEN